MLSLARAASRPRLARALTRSLPSSTSSSSPASDPPRTGDHVDPPSMRSLPDPEDAFRKERRIGLADELPPRGAGTAPAARFYEPGMGSGARGAGQAAAEAAADDAPPGQHEAAAGGETIADVVSHGCEAAAAAAAARRRGGRRRK